LRIRPEVLDALVKNQKQALDALDNAHKKTIALLEQSLDLNQRQIRAALDALGETKVRPEQLASKLLEVAERFKQLQQSAVGKASDDPKIASLKADAQKAIENGDLDKADSVLADVVEEQKNARERLAASEAEAIAQRGDIAMTRLRYGDAAKYYAAAAALLSSASTDNGVRIQYLKKEAVALFRQGVDLGNGLALMAAIDRFRRLADLEPRGRASLDWSVTQSNLGTALMTLSERTRDTATLKESVAVQRAALQELSRARVPRYWAAVQNNLAIALVTLGTREHNSAELEEAVVAFRAALEEMIQERVPLDWAATQNNLGLALAALGGSEDGPDRLEEAVVAYREALKERTRERAPFGWAQSTGNLGDALSVLAMRKHDAALAEEAVKLTEAALDAFASAGDYSAVQYDGAKLRTAQSVARQLHGAGASLDEIKDAKRK
jgi:tetratricopeptide (TPR) repeat protein